MFEQAGRVVDREIARFARYVTRKVKPPTQKDAEAVLRRASRGLAKMAAKLDKKAA